MAVDPLTPTQEEELIARLQALRLELASLLADPTDRAATVDLEQPIGRVSRIDAIQQQRMAQAQQRRQELRQKQVESALAGVEEGEYGLCRRCGEDIGYGRLSARPESPYCLRCAEQLERRR